MTKKRIIPIGSLVLGLVFGLVMLITHLLVRPPSPPSELEGVLRPEYRQVVSFQLQSHNRGPLSEKDFLGKWSYIFFGYLSCPDVCPNTLHELSQFRTLLKDESGLEPENLQVIFISVDPERDSTENLARYVNHFNKKFIGATAGKGAIDRLTKQFGAGYILEAETGPGQYLVTHTLSLIHI